MSRLPITLIMFGDFDYCLLDLNYQNPQKQEWFLSDAFAKVLILVYLKSTNFLALFPLFYLPTAVFYLKWYSLIIQTFRNAATKTVLDCFYPIAVLNDVIWNIDLYLNIKSHLFCFNHFTTGVCMPRDAISVLHYSGKSLLAVEISK